MAQELAAAGIGRLVLAHRGDVKPSDLNRQILMEYDGLGQSRVESAKRRLLALNPRIEIVTVNEKPPLSVVTFTVIENLESGYAGKSMYLSGTAVVTVYQDGSTVQEALVNGHWEGTVNYSDSNLTKRDGTVSFKLERTKVDEVVETHFYVDSITIDGVVYTFTN